MKRTKGGGEVEVMALCKYEYKDLERGVQIVINLVCQGSICVLECSIFSIMWFVITNAKGLLTAGLVLVLVSDAV